MSDIYEGLSSSELYQTIKGRPLDEQSLLLEKYGNRFQEPEIIKVITDCIENDLPLPEMFQNSNYSKAFATSLKNVSEDKKNKFLAMNTYFLEFSDLFDLFPHLSEETKDIVLKWYAERNFGKFYHLIKEKSDIEKKEYIAKYYDKLKRYDIISLMENSSELFFNFFNATKYSLSFSDLLYCIKKVSDSKKIEYLNLYLNQMSSDDVYQVIQSFQEQQYLDLLEQYGNRINFDHIKKLITSCEDKNIKGQLLRKYQEQFEIDFLMKQLPDLDDVNVILEFLSKYKEKIDPNTDDVMRLIDKGEEIYDFFIKNYKEFSAKLNYFGDNPVILKNILEEHLGRENFNQLSVEKKEIYIQILQQSKNASVRSIILKVLEESFALKVKDATNLDNIYLIKYMLNNSDFGKFIHVIDTNHLVYKKLYQMLKTNITKNENFNFSFLVKLAHFIENYPELCNELLTKESFDKSDIDDVVSLLDRRSKLDIKSINELKEMDHLLDEEINFYIEYSKKHDWPSSYLKNAFLRNFCNLTYSEFREILDNDINNETTKKMLEKELSEEERKKIETLDIFIRWVDETINSTDNQDSLRKMLSLINTKEKRAEFSNIYQYFSNIKERIREAYEIDANATLTNLSDLPEDLYDPRYGYYDLSESEYGLYAHVVGTELENLVHPTFLGATYACLTPISDHMVKGFYADGVTVLYDHIPKGNFIGSSIMNLGSNAFIGENNFDTKTIQYHQFEFKDSSSKKAFDETDHSETNVFREGLIPSGVLVRGEFPTEFEKEAQQKLMELTGKNIPLVKVQEVGKKIENAKKIESKTENAYKNLQEFYNYDQLQNQIRQLSQVEIQKSSIAQIRNIKYSTGASHNVYTAQIDGEHYLLKPAMDKDLTYVERQRAYAVEIGYKVQQLVNPTAAIPVQLVEAPIGYEDEKILCSAIKFVPNVHDFEYLDNAVYPNNNYQTLSDSEISTLAKEFIVDYLIINQDVKGANFISDGTTMYGIDKEQALKFTLQSGAELDSKANSSNAMQSMYENVFRSYVDGIQQIPFEVFEELRQIGFNINAMSDEMYFDIFEKYVKEVSNGDDQLFYRYKEQILKRKENLTLEIEKFISNLENQKVERHGYGK